MSILNGSRRMHLLTYASIVQESLLLSYSECTSTKMMRCHFSRKKKYNLFPQAPVTWSFCKALDHGNKD